MPKSSVLRNTTDCYEGDKLLTWSTTISVQPELKKRYKDSTFARLRRPRLRRSMGSSPIISKRHAFRCDPGRIVQVKITGLCAASDCLDFVRSRNPSKQWTAELFTIEIVKLHIDQMMRTRNFGVRSEVAERGSVTKSHEGKKAYVMRKVGECFHQKAHGQCSKGDSCSFSHDRLV